MNGILSIKTVNHDLSAEIGTVMAHYPIMLQEDVREAYQAAEEKDYEKAEKLCCKLLDYKAEPEICLLLGTCYFVQGKMQDARKVFLDLTADDPKEIEYRIYLGMAEHELGRYEEAVKVLGSLYPLSEYQPFYYTNYGDSLQRLGKLKQSREAFYQEVAYFKKTGTVVSAVILDGAFQNLLYLDIKLGNGRYTEDIKCYYDFLDKTEMTEEMQARLAENIVYFCELMSNVWYRPLFLEFITHVRDKGYLTTGETIRVLDSAFASWESYLYHEDRQISSLMETYLVASHERKYSKGSAFTKGDRDQIEATALSYDWYMCQYVREHLAELDYVKETYPHTYADNKEFFEKIKGDAVGMAEKVLDDLHPYAEKVSRKELAEGLYRTYQRACENEKEPAYIYDGLETYRRIQPKVGRNDPCPCGSGKKYKKCCGR